MEGWSQLIEFAPSIVMITMLILGFLVGGIFSGEFSLKADAIFFSTVYGRNKAVAAKMKAGFCLVSIVYFAVMLIYSAVTIFYLGSDGLLCPIQIRHWKSFYNITVWQEYLLILAGGYLGCLFISFLCMLVSAKTKSAVIAMIVPFVLIFIPSFISNINSPGVNKIIGLLPDQMLQIGLALDLFNIYTVLGKTIGAVPIILILYTILTIALMPVLYHVFRNKQIN